MMNNSVLPQLLKAEADLSNREAALSAQLTTVREQRKGLQTVIEMFNAGSLSEDLVPTVTPEAVPEMPPEVVTDPITFETVSPEPGSEGSTEPVKKADSATTAKKKPVRRSAKSSAKSVKPSAGKTAKKRGGSSGWQRYIRKTFKKLPLPEVVATVLQSQPNTVFEIAEVMDAIFTENMPKSDFLKARNRISNILSAGARNGTWYRGRQGRYSLSDKAAKAS